MKRWIFALAAALALLAGCSSNPQPLPATEPPVTERAWEPFTGAVRLYEYYHEDGEARLWEEDIIHMSELYLDDYTQLTPFPSRIQYPNGDVEYDTARYVPELREYYLTRINDLIPKLEGMDSQDILFYLQETVAACHDAHLEVYITGEYQLFPLYLEPLYAEDGTWGFYVLGCKEGEKELPFARLSAINGIPVEEIAQRLKSWISYENEYWLLHVMARNALLGTDYLCRGGILEPGAEEAEFTFVSAEGEEFTRTLASLTQFQYSNLSWDIYGMYQWENHPFTYKKQESNYFFEYHEQTNTIFARVHRFQETQGYTLQQFGNEMLAVGRENGFIDAVVIDLRSNPGGYRSLGFPELFTVLERMDIGTIYVLMDNSTFSNGVFTAGVMKQRLENVVLVGAPAGQPVNFYGSVEDITTPNEKITFRLPGAWWIIDPEDTDEALMPDIQVLQTLEDYQNGMDTVLQAVYAMIGGNQ